MNFKYLFFLGLMACGLVSCFEEDVDVYPVGSATETATSFESILLNNRTLNFVIPKIAEGQMEPVGLQVTMAAAPKSSDVNFTYDITDPTNVQEGTEYQSSGSGVIPAGSTSAEIPVIINLDNNVVGQTNTMSVQLTSADLEFNKTPVTFSYAVVCESQLAGEYIATTTGTSTDDCCPDETTVMGEVVVTETAPGTYSLSDFSAGLYLEWYAVYGITPDSDLSGSVVDVCSTVSGTFPEPFQTDVIVDGSVDNATGVITYTWVNGYDDTATVTLTPK